MSLSCAGIRARFASYAAEKLSSAERRAVREHLSSCGACREEAAAAEPTLLFAAPQAIGKVAEADVARILEGVRAAVAVRQTERVLADGASRRRRARSGLRTSVVAAAAAVALFTLALPGGLKRTPTSAVARTVTPALAKASALAAPDRSAGQAAVGVRVYEIAPGAGPDEPRVIWIVDGSLDI